MMTTEEVLKRTLFLGRNAEEKAILAKELARKLDEKEAKEKERKKKEGKGDKNSK